MKACRHILFACLLFLLKQHCCAAESNSDILTQKAIELGLDRTRTWQVLGHYQVSGSRWVSRIRDTNFFLSPDGFKDPRAELEATIKSLYSDNSQIASNCFCRFPARSQWLETALSPLNGATSFTTHNPVTELLDRIDPNQAVLVFPGPAFKGLGAMFGHTLIRFDTINKPSLISYTVSYAAVAKNENLATYIWKGLAGGFNGYYAMSPYYQKLHEYSDMEERDIWEYPLKLNSDEVKMMVLHSIELDSIPTRYFFLDENCALNLLYIIEAGRPALKLVEHFQHRPDFWVIPSETILFLQNLGVLEHPIYQPSLSRQIDFLSKTLPNEFVVEAKRRATGTAPDHQSKAIIPGKADNVAVNTLAAKIVQYHFSKLQLRQEVFESKYLGLIADGITNTVRQPPTPAPPDSGHSSQRTRTAIGLYHNEAFVQLGWRPAYHDLTDPPAGYPDWGILELLDVSGRYYPKTAQIKLQDLKLIEAGSLSPENRITKQSCWEFNTGVAETFLKDERLHLEYYLDGGMGKSISIGENGTAYVLGKGSLLAGGNLSASIDFGPEVDTGFVWLLAPSWQLICQEDLKYYTISQHSFISDTGVSLSRYFSRNNGIAIKAEIFRANLHKGIAEFTLSWQHYF